MSLLALWEIARWLLPFAGAAVGWWVRDRRREKAATDVAERTVPAEVKLKDIGADQAELVYVTQAFESERASLHRQIADRDAEIERQRADNEVLRAEVARREARITSLIEQVDHLQVRVVDVTRELTSVREQLSAELAQTEDPC